jgi:hypothetical protein
MGLPRDVDAGLDEILRGRGTARLSVADVRVLPTTTNKMGESGRIN